MVTTSRRAAALRLKALCAALALAALTPLRSAPAGASEPPVTAAVLPVELSGTADPDGELTRAVRDAVGEHLALVPSAKVVAAWTEQAGGRCDGPDCIRRLAASTSARWVVRGIVTADGSDYELEVAFADGRTGTVRASEGARCTACGWAEVAPRLAELARAGWQRASKLPEEAPATARTDATSGTRLPLDGGATGPPGGNGGATASTGMRGITVGKWVAAAAAVGLIATSAVLFAYDGKGTCDLPADAAGLRCPRSYQTTLEAGLLLGGGALAAGAAAALFVLDRRRPFALAPAALLHPAGVTVGVQGRF